MPETIATWGGAEIQLVSDEVVAAIDAARSFLDLLNDALSIALEVSNIAKTFVTSNLNLARSLLATSFACSFSAYKDMCRPAVSRHRIHAVFRSSKRSKHEKIHK